MALHIDITQPRRTLPELRELVEAIRDAPAGEPETDALEWKRTLDISGRAEDRFNLARHVLGMGNRMPDVASRSFDGCGYVLIGVEPGAVTGCDVWDPADIDNWLTPYIAPGSPRWHITYIEVDGGQVLVVTVEPPRPGDGFFTLQRDYAGSRAGRTFVRRGGTTQEASPAEIRALEGRLLGARPAVDVQVVPVGAPEVTALRHNSDAGREWINAEAERYERALRRYERERDARTARPFYSVDPRSTRAYLDEVNAYLQNSDRRFRALVYERAIAESRGALLLEVHNPTDRNFERVEVTLRLPREIQAFFDADEVRELLGAPSPPEELGSKSPLAVSFPDDFVLPAGGDRIERDHEATTIRYAPLHMRPGARERLSPVFLSVDASNVAADIEVPWRATSTSVDRWADGVFVLPVAACAVDLSPGTAE